MPGTFTRGTELQWRRPGKGEQVDLAIALEKQAALMARWHDPMAAVQAA